MTMTRTEGERLAVVEDQLNNIRADVAELKGDMKVLLASNAARSSSDARGMRFTDIMMRVIPLLFSTFSLLMTLIAMVVIVQEQGGIK